MCVATPPSDDRIARAITEIEFEVSDPAYFFVGLSDDRGCRVRLEELIRRSDGTLVEFFSADDCPPGPVHDRADRTDVIDSARIVGRRGGDLVFLIELSGRCVAETIEGAGAVPRSIRATDGSGTVIAQVPRGVDTGAVIDTVLEHHPALNLVARRERDIETPVFVSPTVRDLLWEQLTDRQEEVLRTAYRNGYFRRPRECSGEEIAEMLGITSATFSQHLRAAQDNLLSFLVDDGVDDRDRRSQPGVR